METTTAGKIGKYAIVREIAQGGFGKTLLAETAEGKRVVLKQFNPQQHNVGSQALRLFDQECNRLKEVESHEQIPSFIEYFEEGGNRFIVQEFVDGQTLKDELKEAGTFSEGQIISLLKDILPVIKFVHDKNVIHRDIKPENIIRRSVDGKLFLVDFGASKPVSDTILAKTGTMIGSPLYVAPEQSRGKPKYASDVYSLGLTCAHLLTYASPFEFEDVETGTLIWRNFCQQPVAEPLALIIDKMLERGLKNRYSKASQVLDALTEMKEQGNKDLLDPESTFLWEQLEDEPDAWFERFQIFLHLTSGERDVSTAYFLLDEGDSDCSLEEWVTYSNRFNWEARANAYDTSAIGRFFKQVQEGGKPGSGPLATYIRPLIPLVATVSIFVGLLNVVFSDPPPIGQEPPTAITEPSQAHEGEGGFSLPRFPLIDDMRDELVADEVWPEGSMISIDHVFLLVKIIIVLNFGGMFLRVLLNFRIPRSISGSD